jgi:uncharacterized membrane protein YhaH (DUF805 family)
MNFYSGRMNRKAFWLSFLLCIALYGVMNYFSTQPIGVSEAVLAILCVPRLHDIGKSGWYVLIGVGVEAAGLGIGFSFFPMEEAMGIAGLATLVIFGLMAWLGAIPGDPNPNRWGEPPVAGLSFKQKKA